MPPRPGFISPAVARRAMTRRELTVLALAARAGVSPVTVRNWLSGRTAPGPQKLNVLAQVLGVEVRDLTGVQEGQELLADLRIHAALTQSEVAAATGVGQSTLSEIERGGNGLSPELRDQLASLYGVAEDAVQAAWQRCRDTLTGNG